jgi:hypothetical protein
MRSEASFRKHPLHPMLIAFPAVPRLINYHCTEMSADQVRLALPG